MTRQGAPRGSTAAPIDSLVATGRGDDGTTGLLYGGPRIPKDDPRTEAYGTIDEAVAVLGLARAELASGDGAGSGAGAAERGAGAAERGAGLAGLAEVILRIQRGLFVVGAELATTPEGWSRLEDGRTRVSAAMVDELTARLEDLERRIEMPREFVVAGETRASAALELARTIVRRAERRAVTLDRDGLLPGPHLLPYLNRLADLIWVLARAAEQAEDHTSTPARVDGRRRSRPASAGSNRPVSDPNPPSSQRGTSPGAQRR
jgi:cob(I)alamin adenosyltransferase